MDILCSLKSIFGQSSKEDVIEALSSVLLHLEKKTNTNTGEKDKNSLKVLIESTENQYLKEYLKLQENDVDTNNNNNNNRICNNEIVIDNRFNDVNGNDKRQALFSVLPKNKKHIFREYLEKEIEGNDYYNMKIFEEYLKKLQFMRSFVDQTGKKTTEICDYHGKVINNAELRWKDDPWFEHLCSLQNLLYVSDKFKDDQQLSVFSSSHVTYCLLIRNKKLHQVNEQQDKYDYFIYIGKQGLSSRWNRSGSNHMAQVRKIFKKEMKNDFSACDIALSLFDPSDCIVCVIDVGSKEGELSLNFPHYDKQTKIDMRHSTLSLSPIKGN